MKCLEEAALVRESLEHAPIEGAIPALLVREL
jgi:hypothetical protein